LTIALTAEAIGAKFPPLLVAADRVAATVAQGVHGRRRVGVGDSFWQYRPFVEGDSAARIDWRRSARTDRAYVRDMEWEAAQTVCLWRDASPSMRWRSSRNLDEKRGRADLLLLAVAALLFRAGEQVRLIGLPGRIFRGRTALGVLAASLSALTGETPPRGALPAHGRVVLFGDFLGPLEQTREAIQHLSGQRLRGHLMQVLDPAELALPYEGRVRFQGLENEADAIVPRVEGVRAAYADALAAQQAGLAALCAAAGFGFSVHRTDHPPEAALLALWMALDASAARR
jgi:uncharacterized protein (DUF58 family)